ncbi:histidine kinase [Solirubrobacter soli]|uniref:histidine kinase n=1 Tax=Solirubrobacter soli TaxID=363832 RepID=UPI000412EBB5|nr:histidine kinase [Solirubrobacter soli]
MAASPAEIRERDLLSRLAAGTAGVVGAAFLRRLVQELKGALEADVAFVAELVEHRPGYARTIASAYRPGMELREGHEFALKGTPCEHAYDTDLLLVRRGARLRYPADTFLGAHGLDGYLAIPLRGADSRAIGHIGLVSAGPLDPKPSELHALQVFAARAAAELDRRRHERALRARADEVVASRARAVHAADEERRRIGRDLHDGAQQRLVVLGQSIDLALRQLQSDPEGAQERLAAAREQASLAGRELRELARGLHPVGLERGLAGALAALATHSALPVELVAVPDRRLPDVVETTIWFLVSEALSNAIKHAGASRLEVDIVLHGRTLVARVSDDGAGGANAAQGTGLQGLQARIEALGGRFAVQSIDGTTLTATIPLAPWRTATDPFLEFGHDGDGGKGLRKIEELLTGARTTGVSLAREWELEGGPPRIGQRLPVFDHTGRRHGLVEIVRVAVMPFGEIDPATVDPEPGEADWHVGRAKAYQECREEIAALLGEPNWRLTETEPMVILTYRSVPAAEISGSIL